MNYLPVKRFDMESPFITVPGIVMLSALVLLVIFLWLFSRTEDRKQERASSVFSRLAAVVGGAAILSMVFGAVAIGYSFLGFNRINERNHTVQAQIEKDYDLKLSRMEFHDLNYPEFRPQEDFTVYGSIQKDLQLDGAAYRSAKLSLVWSEGKFYLSESTNGEDFQPLSAKR